MINNLKQIGMAFSVVMAGIGAAQAEEIDYVPPSDLMHSYQVDPVCVYDQLSEFAYVKRPQTATIYRGILDDSVYTWKIEINMNVVFTEASQGDQYPVVKRVELEYDNNPAEKDWETKMALEYLPDGQLYLSSKDEMPDLIELDRRLRSCAPALTG